MLLKNILASRVDKKVTITNGEMRKLIGAKYSKDEVTVYYYGLVPITFKSTRRGTTWYAKQLLPNFCDMPSVGKPMYFEITLKSKDSTGKLQQSPKIVANRDKGKSLNLKFGPSQLTVT